MTLRGCIALTDIENSDVEKLTKMSKRLEDAKAHAGKRCKREYIHALTERHRLNKDTGTTPKMGEIVLVVEMRRTAENGRKERWGVSFKVKMELLEV